MDGKTLIQENKSALEDSIASRLSHLEARGLGIVEAAWLNPEPTVWSVDIHATDCALCRASGTGASREAALASALAKYAKRLANNWFFADYFLGSAEADKSFYHHPSEQWFPAEQHWPKGLIDEPSLQALYNPEGALTPAHLVDTSSGDAARGVCAMPYLRLSDGKKQWFPVNLIANLYVQRGMAVGDSREQARTQALAELLEHYVKFQVITEGIALPDVPEQVIVRFPRAVELIEALRNHGYGVLLRDASLGGKYPVVSVTLLNPENGTCLANFGAHPRFEVALENTLSALLQNTQLEQLAAFSEPSFEQDKVAAHSNLQAHFVDSSGLMPWTFFSDKPEYAFEDWDFGAESHDEYTWIRSVFDAEDHQVYLADYEHLGFHACHAIAPGLSEIYAPDTLEWDNNNAAVPWRHTLLNLHAADNEQLADLAEWIDNKHIPTRQAVAALIGIASDANSPWQALRVGHLRLWLALALKQHQDLPDLCHWAIDFGESNDLDVRLYRCIAALFGLSKNNREAEHFKASLNALYPTELLRLARSLIDTGVRFPGLHDPGESLDDMKLHRSLIAVHQKLRNAMAQQHHP